MFLKSEMTLQVYFKSRGFLERAWRDGIGSATNPILARVNLDLFVEISMFKW